MQENIPRPLYKDSSRTPLFVKVIARVQLEIELDMFSKFRVPKRDLAHLDDGDPGGLILVSTSRVSGTGPKRCTLFSQPDVSDLAGIESADLFTIESVLLV